MDFISVFDEASRDIEAEAVERRHTAALQDATAATWQFLALAKSEPEFGHRLALVEDRLEALASQHGVSYEEITAPLRQGFQALLESREAAGRGPKVAAEHSAGYGLKATDVVGYTADADMHCVDCAHRIYGDDKGGSEPKQDGEGNQVHPIFASDEGWDDEHCGTCGKPLSEGRRIYSSLQAQAGTKCAECGHSSDEHVRGAVCPTCGCTSFTARTAALMVEATGDPAEGFDPWKTTPSRFWNENTPVYDIDRIPPGVGAHIGEGRFVQRCGEDGCGALFPANPTAHQKHLWHAHQISVPLLPPPKESSRTASETDAPFPGPR